VFSLIKFEEHGERDKSFFEEYKKSLRDNRKRAAGVTTHSLFVLFLFVTKKNEDKQ